MAETLTEAQAAEIDALHASLAQWQRQSAIEAQARQDAEERFSRDLEAQRAQHRHEAEMFSGEVRFAKLQIEAARSAERERLQAEEALGTARLELAEIKGQSSALEERLAEMQQRLKDVAKSGGKAVVRTAIKRGTLR